MTCRPKKIYVYDGSSPYSYYPGGGPQADPGYGANTGIKTVRTILQFDTGKEGVDAALPGHRAGLSEDVDGSELLIGEDTIRTRRKTRRCG